MAKKDASIQENTDRGPDQDKGSGAISDRNNNIENDVDNNGFTNVENANAAGMGAMGRNDEKQTDFTSNKSSDG